MCQENSGSSVFRYLLPYICIACATIHEWWQIKRIYILQRMSELITKAGKVEIIPMQTGTVAVKKRFKQGRFPNALSKPDFIFDSQFTEQLPIWTWLIKHPEGIFIIDTGENERVNDKNYFDNGGFITKWVNQNQFKFEITKEQEIGNQLKALNISNHQIKSVLLTHLHIDHIDGLKDFEGVDILVNELEWSKPNFPVPFLYPKWLAPKTMHLTNSISGFNSKAITESNDLFLIHTPGHTLGHCSILLEGIDHSIIFAGDVVYDQEQLQNNILAGANQSYRLTRQTYHTLNAYLRKTPTIFLPSHDTNAKKRLERTEVYK
jgi:N-acyl homoserine lactone hydrolase